MRSNARGCGEVSSCRSSLRMARASPQSGVGSPRYPRPRLFGTEWMLRRLRAGDHLVDGRLLAERALDRLLRRLVVEIVNLLVVARIPVDEHTDHHAVVVGLVLRDDAARDRIDDGARHGRLRRAEHLRGLLRALDRDLV